MDDQQLDKRRIRVDYYQGAYGPTIRIDTHTIDELLKIKSLFLNLAESKLASVNFIDSVDACTEGLDELVLERAETTDKPDKHLRKEDQMGHLRFVWSLPSSGWTRCAGLIDGVIGYNLPSHQYLSREGVDDALIEIAFQESN